MGAQGTAVINFGSFPGSCETTVTITGLTGILAGSLVDAWLFPKDTADHTADEHFMEDIVVTADPQSIVAGTSFVVRARLPDRIFPPDPPFQYGGTGLSTVNAGDHIGYAPTMRGNFLLYGQYTIAWVWN